MAWPTWVVGKKLTGTMWADVKDYLDNLSGSVAATANLLVRRDANGNANVGIDLRQFGKFTVVSASLTPGSVSDRTLTVTAAPSVSNDPIFTIVSGQLVIGAPGVYLITVSYDFGTVTSTRKFAELMNVAGVDLQNGRMSPSNDEQGSSGSVMVTVATTGTVKLQAYQLSGASTFTAYLRVQRLARLT